MGLLLRQSSCVVFWLFGVFCRFSWKDGVVFLTCGLLAPLALGAAEGRLLAGTVAADLATSVDPVFLGRGLR